MLAKGMSANQTSHRSPDFGFTIEEDFPCVAL